MRTPDPSAALIRSENLVLGQTEGGIPMPTIGFLGISHGWTLNFFSSFPLMVLGPNAWDLWRILSGAIMPKRFTIPTTSSIPVPKNGRRFQGS